MDEGTGRVEEKTDRPLHWSVVRRESRPSITLAGVNILYQVRIVIIIVKNSQTLFVVVMPVLLKWCSLILGYHFWFLNFRDTI